MQPQSSVIKVYSPGHMFFPCRVCTPGHILSQAIFYITGERACGVCQEHKEEMDSWGWIGSWKRRKTIIGWLREEAEKRGHKMHDARLEHFIKVAIHDFRLKGKPQLYAHLYSKKD